MSQNAPVAEEAEATEAVALPRPPIDRRTQQRRWDLMSVGVLTPALLLGIALGVLMISQLFYPDPNPPEFAIATGVAVAAREREIARLTPTVAIVVPPIDTARLNAGLVDKPSPFEWPDVDDLRVVPNPGRPNEQADYVPAVSSDQRRLIAATSVMIAQHTNVQFVGPALDEIAKSYPVRARKQQVLDINANTGYLPDESGFAVVLPLATFRIHLETIVASPPIAVGQRATIEEHTLHLAEHITRRLQESASGGKRTGPEATAVHVRDHLVRRLSFGGG